MSEHRTNEAGIACEHGQLRRSCNECERDSDAEELIAEAFGVEAGAVHGKTVVDAILEIRRLHRELRNRSANPALEPAPNVCMGCSDRGVTLDGKPCDWCRRAEPGRGSAVEPASDYDAGLMAAERIVRALAAGSAERSKGPRDVRGLIAGALYDAADQIGQGAFANRPETARPDEGHGHACGKAYRDGLVAALEEVADSLSGDISNCLARGENGDARLLDRVLDEVRGKIAAVDVKGGSK